MTKLPNLPEDFAGSLILRMFRRGHAEMDYLADVGAIRVITVEGTRIAELTERGKRHLERNFVLEGVKRPDREET